MMRLLILILFIPLASCHIAQQDGLLYEKKFVISLDNSNVNVNEQEDLPYLFIKDGDSFYGFSGCNRFFGAVVIDSENNEISFVNIAGTRMLCFSQVQKLEDRIFLNLRKAKYYSISKQEVTLLDEEMAPIIYLLIKN